MAAIVRFITHKGETTTTNKMTQSISLKLSLFCSKKQRKKHRAHNQLK